MKIAFLSDVHGNMPALQEALKLIEESGAYLTVFLGDAVHYGPSPEAAVKLLMESDVECLQGNCDRAAARGRKNTGENYDNSHWRNIASDFFQWTCQALSKESKKWLKSLPEELRFQLDKTTILCVHGIPGRQNGMLPANAAAEIYDGILTRAGADIVVCGMTHTPAVIRRPSGLILNPGSVGGGTLPAGGTFMILSFPDKGFPEVETVQFSYSTEELRKQYTKAGRGELFLRCAELGRDQRGNWHTDKPEWRQKWADFSL
ncbi:hypothetical protein CSA37_06785 [Candidatus Fermentibacteria bacterium]|nr:MAG: hypothetical protein CSA37_06785 [Candidatus Fermentibacteria bacterium]